MKLSVHIEDWELKQPFRITGKEWTSSPTLVVELTDGDAAGRGEGQGIFYTGETVESMFAQVESVAGDIERGISQIELLDLLPVGGARNAVDCALWDLQAKRTGKSIWELTGMHPRPVTTVFTIGIEDTPERMAAKAAAAAEYPVLKIKLDGTQPYERLSAIRAARPDAELVVDANQGWSFDQLQEVIPKCVELRLGMIEQPLPRGADAELEGFESPITLAADESCLDTAELGQAVRRYDMINIKLDKTGGLTEALALARGAKEQGCKLMVGNMMGTSLAMAPSFVVAQLCDFVDIDGPLLLKWDRPHALNYRSGEVDVFDKRLWG
ncbi:MAG: dipeptide epimerase [Proteobacteria bacterium]|nr:dipeptide epimerase [Pseudomonadota bacterium]